jgi:hypothetical protein
VASYENPPNPDGPKDARLREASLTPDGSPDTPVDGRDALVDSYDARLDLHDALVDASTDSASTDPPWIWAVSTADKDAVYGIAIDDAGFSYVVGASNKNGFLVKLASDGSQAWRKELLGAEWIELRGVAVNAAGTRIYVCGSIKGSATFAGQTVSGPLHNWDVLVAALAANGSSAWQRVIGHALATDECSSISQDSAQLYVAGYTNGGFTVNTPTGHSGRADMFVFSLSKGGIDSWAVGIGGRRDDLAHQLVVASGNIYVAGESNGAISFAGSSYPARGSSDAIIASITTAGTPRWMRQIGGSGWDDAAGVAVDSQGNLYVGGSVSATVDFGADSVTVANGRKAFLASYTFDNRYRWARVSSGGAGDSVAWSLASRGGTVYAVGTFLDAISFGGSGLVSLGSADIFFARSSAGGRVELSRVGGSGYDDGAAIAVGNHGLSIGGSAGGDLIEPLWNNHHLAEDAVVIHTSR